jgi:glutamate dehydrogenase (NADP+)
MAIPLPEPVARLFGARFAEALGHAPLSAEALRFLSGPSLVCRTRLSFSGGDAGSRTVDAWRLRFGDVFGPCKGGVRFHPGVTEANLTALAARILLKCAVNDLPHGGAAGGVAVDPRTLGPEGRAALARAYVTAYADLIGGDRDVLSPDVGTDAGLMSVMSETLDTLRRRFEPAAINGKPPGRGGVPGRHGATARGAFAVMETILENENARFDGLRVAIQGFGAAGGTFATEAVARGARVVAAADSSACLSCDDGLPVGDLLVHKAAGRRFAELAAPGVRVEASEGVFATRADWLVCAALGGAVDADRASALHCGHVLELANAAVDDAGDAVLRRRGVTVVPDVVVNAGGITVSHFEWVQGRTGAPFTATEVGARLDARMRWTAQRLRETAAEAGVSLTIAAQLLARDRLHAALESRP